MWFEDVAVGVVTELGSHHFEADEIVRFGRAFDPQPFHVSEDAGKASHFGGLAASGWHTAAIWQRLATTHANRLATGAATRGEAMPPVVLMPSVADLRWLKPVLSGDTLAYRMIVAEKMPSETNPGWGVVISRVEGTNQRGELAFAFTARDFAKIKG